MCFWWSLFNIFSRSINISPKKESICSFSSENNELAIYDAVLKANKETKLETVKGRETSNRSQLKTQERRKGESIKSEAGNKYGCIPPDYNVWSDPVQCLMTRSHNSDLSDILVYWFFLICGLSGTIANNPHLFL